MRSETVGLVDGEEVVCPECGAVGSFGQHEHDRPTDSSEDVPVVDTDHQTALRIIGAEAERHVRTHTGEWLKVQRQKKDRYGSMIYASDIEECAVCYAYAVALDALTPEVEES